METFESAVKKIVDLHESKNTDYGNAFGKSFALYEGFGKGEGLKYATGRLGDKMSRLQNLAYFASNPKNESILDTLEDLAAYAIMTIIELKNQES